MWLKHTLSTQPRHKNSKATWAYHMGEAFQAVTAPANVLGTGHVYCTGQVWALESHKYCPYILHRHTWAQICQGRTPKLGTQGPEGTCSTVAWNKVAQGIVEQEHSHMSWQWQAARDESAHPHRLL